MSAVFERFMIVLNDSNNMLGNKKFTKTQLEVIRILLDNHGHSLSDLSEKLNKKESNMIRVLKDLEKRLLIRRGDARIPEESDTVHKEYPYFLYYDLSIITSIIKQERLDLEAKYQESYLIGFPQFLGYLAGSEYFEAVLSGDEEWMINLIMEAGALSRSYVKDFIELHNDKYNNPEDYY
jgi:predicted transcriptional regulator